MSVSSRQPEIAKSALIIVDMQNDFVHRDGGFACIARDIPEAAIDMPFLMGTIPQVKRLADAFRGAGRPVVYLAHVVKPDYSDAQFPYWRVGVGPGTNRTFIAEGTWGSQVVDELKPRDGELLIVKKGFGGFPIRRSTPSCGTWCDHLCHDGSDNVRMCLDHDPRRC